MAYDLDFEKPLSELERKLSSLQRRGEKLRPEERAQIRTLERELEQQTREIYVRLTPWQRVQVARHRARPYTRDYIRLMCDDFFELRGDRRHADDRAMQGGMACLDGRTIMILGQQKGRDTRERQENSFGMAHAEGYRKALRMMQHAERFRMPIVTLIDTPGAALDLAAEQRGIAQAIAENLINMARLKTPILCVVIGEGGSGGALGIGIGDRVLMMENAYYTVASPEAAASILWRDAAYAASAAENMRITAKELHELGLVEDVVPEPLGGAHRDHREAARLLKEAIVAHLDELVAVPPEELLVRRYERFRAIGAPAARPMEAAVSATAP